MSTKYWIKLYHEVLDDPKTARLPDNLWRRFFEFCLLAGESGYEDDDPQNGRLPSPSDMSWRLRVDEETLNTELDALARKGFIEYRANNVLDGYWFITQFNARQRKMDKAEYMRRLRESRGGVTPQLPTSYQPVTNGNADKDIDKDIDKNKIKKETPLTLPPNLDTPQFNAIWKQWKQYKGGSIKALTYEKQLERASQECNLHGVTAVCGVFEATMSNGWKGLFWEKIGNGQPYAAQGNGRINVAAIMAASGIEYND